MDGFSAIMVAVPLIVPFAARFHLHPFHLAIMFLLNLEIAYLAPPLGLNLYISSFRFSRPVVSLYRVVVPFLAILGVGLLVVMFVPKVSTMLVDGDIRKAREKAAAVGEPPREAWQMECVQTDRNHPEPCSEEDKKKWPDEVAQPPEEPREQSPGEEPR